ncbi:MAG TPA: hypothetical protein VMW52_10715 [Phycisphaerae bacterium]|nr:hypothetical protein [Phycisphaerae bacterium]
MNVTYHRPGTSWHYSKRYPVYLLRGEPADARLVVRLHDEDRVVTADEARGQGVSFLDATDEELWILRGGGYWIAERGAERKDLR